jgi:hypothetical protein
VDNAPDNELPVDPNNAARSIVGAALGKIPYVGGLAATIVGLLWPKNRRDVWPSIEARATELVARMIDEENLARLKLELDGLKNLVSDLADYEKDTDRSRRQFQIVLSFFDDRRPLFCVPGKMAGNMPFFMEMASMHLAFLKARCDNPASITKGPVGDEELGKWKTHLADMITLYHQSALEGYKALQKSRSEAIQYEPIWSGVVVWDRFQARESRYTYAVTPGSLNDQIWCSRSRRLVLEDEWNREFFKKYMIPAYGWLGLDARKAPSEWHTHSPALESWLLGLQEKQQDPHHYKPFPIHDEHGGHAWWSDKDYSVTGSGKLEWLHVWYSDTIDAIAAKFAGKDPITSRISEPKPHEDPPQSAPKAGKQERLVVPQGRYLEQLRARIDFNLVGLQVIYSDHSKWAIETDAARAGRGTWYSAAMTDYGVGSLTLGERCSGIKVGLVPKGQLL